MVERTPHIVVIDYHKGNLSSMVRGLVRAGAAAEASDDLAAIRAADGLVLPGVGSFYDAIAFMRESGQDEAVIEALAGGAGTPFLGICLGQQLLFERGEEGVPADAPVVPATDAQGSGLAPGTVFEADEKRWVRGLGVLAGSCTLLPSLRLKVPHVGWDQVYPTECGRACPVLAGFDEGANAYFTHSYALADDVDPAVVAARTHYVRNFASIVWQGNIFGCQFHPEKSSAHGARILENFVAVVARHAGSVADAGAADGAVAAGVAAGPSVAPAATKSEVIA